MAIRSFNVSDTGIPCSRRWRATLMLGLVVASCSLGCTGGSPETSGGTAGSGGSSGSGSSGSSGSGGAAGSSGGAAGAAGSPRDASSEKPADGGDADGRRIDANPGDTLGDKVTADVDGPTCTYAPPPPPSCYVADPPPPETPGVQCLRTARQIWSGVSKIRARDGVLYANAGGVIWRRNGDATETIATPSKVVDFDVSGDTVVFLTQDQRLHRQKLDGTGFTTLVTFDAYTFAKSEPLFHFDGERLFFTTQTDSPQAQIKVVWTLIASANGVVEPVVGPTTVGQMLGSQGVLIDATHIYWNEGSGSPPSDVTLKRVAKGKANVETVAEHLPGWVVQLLDDQVLVSVPEPNQFSAILSVPKSGGCPRFLLHASGPLIADERELYWYRVHRPLLLLERDLFRAPLEGGVNIQMLDARGMSTSIHWAELTPSKVILLSDNATVWELDRF